MFSTGTRDAPLVKEGLGLEKGMRFEARAADPDEAERRLKLEIEAAFA